MSARAAAVVPVLLPGYACHCARCGHAWMSHCDCLTPTTCDDDLSFSIHARTCAPPRRCPRCKAPGWERPAAWTPGEGTSRESLRRRKLERAAIFRSFESTAKTHKAADLACGRKWCCACAACRNVRATMRKKGNR
jgi:hypothetical protein